MLEIRKSNERGYANHDWLRSYHSFSFAEYYDPNHVAFGPLRVINEDRVEPGKGFGTHGHRDMEIISYVLSGALEHKDSMGNCSVLRYGDVQRMSAGRGVRHSEFNHSSTELVHFLQIWIQPNLLGVDSGYEEKHFSPEEKRGVLRLIASPDGRDGSVSMNQDARLYASVLDGADEIRAPLAPGRRAYVHVARGALKVNGVALEAGDALKIRDESEITLNDARQAEVLLFELP